MAYPHTENREDSAVVLPDWDDFRLLLAVVRQGSFSRAAAALGLTQPTVSRRIERLEKSLDVRLIDRTRSGAVLTQEGQRIVEELNIAQGALENAVQGARRNHARRDDVKLLITDGLASYWLPRLLPVFLDLHPDVELRVFTTSDPVAESRAHYDLSIHYMLPTDPNTVAIRLGTLHFIPYASPAYLAKHGFPKSPAELSRHRLLDYILYVVDKGTWLTRLPTGEGRAQLFTNSSAMLGEAVRSGVGIALLPTYASVFEQGLVALEMGMRFETPFWLCYRGEASARRSTRIAVAFLKHIFNRKTMPWFGEAYVSPERFGATTAAEIMADYSVAAAGASAPIEYLASA